jgi:hypothetical protein
MDLYAISNIFSVRKGYIYRYNGTCGDHDPAGTVTENLSILLRKNDFVSSVIQIQGVVYVYINQSFPEGIESPEFTLLGNVETAIEEYNLRQEEYLRSLQPTPEPEPDPTPEPEPEEPQNAS